MEGMVWKSCDALRGTIELGEYYNYLRIFKHGK